MIIEIPKEAAEEIHRLNGVVLELQADNTRLRSALGDIADMYEKDKSSVGNIAREALEGK